MADVAPAPEERWIYRKRDDAPSEQVEVLDVTQDGRKTRVRIRFVDDDRVESVPPGRLRDYWTNLASYEQSVANWDKLMAFELHETEEWAIDDVFRELVPEAVAVVEGMRQSVLRIADPSALESFIGCPIDELTAASFSYTEDDVLLLAREGALIAAELICRKSPQPILDMIHNEERETREHCKNGRIWGKSRTDGRPDKSDPHFEWHVYVTSTRPRHELLRQWCGFRAVTADERRRAAEDEARRLDLLLADAIKELERLESPNARWMREQHESERITPERVRP